MFRFSHRAMDTEFALVADCADRALAGAAAAAAFARIDSLELTLSRFNDTSDVAVIRSLREGERARIAAETMELLETCARAAAATGGAFDPALGRGFGRLALDTRNMLVEVRPPAEGGWTPLELDFGGIGKGYALDECRKIIEGELFALDRYLLDAGTSTVWAQGATWPLGIGGRWKARTRRETVLRLSGCALSGSGTELKGEHVVDPRKGVPARRWEQTWAVAATAAEADALSTAALSMGAAEISRACKALGTQVFAARRQPEAFDRFRDPVAAFGAPPART